MAATSRRAVVTHVGWFHFQPGYDRLVDLVEGMEDRIGAAYDEGRADLKKIAEANAAR